MGKVVRDMRMWEVTCKRIVRKKHWNGRKELDGSKITPPPPFFDSHSGYIWSVLCSVLWMQFCPAE